MGRVSIVHTHEVVLRHAEEDGSAGSDLAFFFIDDRFARVPSTCLVDRSKKLIHTDASMCYYVLYPLSQANSPFLIHVPLLQACICAKLHALLSILCMRISLFLSSCYKCRFENNTLEMSLYPFSSMNTSKFFLRYKSIN